MKDLITSIAKATVDNPEEEVTEINGMQRSVIETKIFNEDIGKIIGKHCPTAVATRTILSAASMKL